MRKINVKVFTGKIILTMDESFHEVELYSEDKKLKKGNGYIRDSLVYIYWGKLDKIKTDDLKCGIYMNDKNKYIFIEPSNDKKSNYSIDNLIELDLEKIFKEITENVDDFVHPEDIEVINNNAEAYTPTIKDEDDFLKFIVKKVLLLKKTNLKNYKDKFSSLHELNNMKSSLRNKTKMTVLNFDRWAQVLGFKWKIEVEDNGVDKLSPLKEPVVFKSDTF